MWIIILHYIFALDFEVSILDVIFLASFNVKKKCIRLIGINLTRIYCSYFINSIHTMGLMRTINYRLSVFFNLSFIGDK